MVLDMEPSKKLKLSHLILLLLLHYSITLLLVEGSKIFSDPNEASRIIEQKDLPFIKFLFVIQWILAPIKEELKYRWLLGGFNYTTVVGSASIFIVDLLLTVFYINFLKESDLHNILYYILVIPISIFSFYLMKSLLKYNNSGLEYYYNKYYKYLILFSILSFAIWHTFTYSNYTYYPLITVFSIHLISALFFTFIRIRAGILQVILYHFIYNLTILLIYLI